MSVRPSVRMSAPPFQHSLCVGVNTFHSRRRHLSLCRCRHLSLCRCRHLSLCRCQHLSLCRCQHLSLLSLHFILLNPFKLFKLYGTFRPFRFYFLSVSSPMSESESHITIVRYELKFSLLRAGGGGVGGYMGSWVMGWLW